MQRVDLDFATECTQGEEWVSEDAAALEGFFLNDPAGCLIAELSGQAAGICIATPYGNSGFIGELIVRPWARGQGIGAALLDHGVAYLHARGVETVYLDGVLKAVGLYERHGFRKICRSLRFSGQPEARPHPGVRAMLEDDLDAVCALDRLAFGADRGFFIRRRFQFFPTLGKVLVEDGGIAGYILGRSGEGWAAAGPWVVAEGVERPERLLEAFALRIGDTAIGIRVLENNHRAIVLMKSLGFVDDSDSPWRMAKGPDEDLGTSPQCYASGSAAKG
jgi:ribosomal protein S18 acetylase RimI-like enzyme